MIGERPNKENIESLDLTQKVIILRLWCDAFNTIIKLFFTIHNLCMNNYSNIDISQSSFSGIPTLI